MSLIGSGWKTLGDREHYERLLKDLSVVFPDTYGVCRVNRHRWMNLFSPHLLVIYADRLLKLCQPTISQSIDSPINSLLTCISIYRVKI